LRNSASRWLLLEECITMHGPLNVSHISRTRRPTSTCRPQNHCHNGSSTRV